MVTVSTVIGDPYLSACHMILFELVLISMQIKLNCIDGKVFPLPQTIMSDCSTSTHSQGQPVLQTPTGLPSLQGSDLMKYNLRPATRVNTVETVDQPLSIAAIQAQLRTGQHLPCPNTLFDAKCVLKWLWFMIMLLHAQACTLCQSTLLV